MQTYYEQYHAFRTNIIQLIQEKAPTKAQFIEENFDPTSDQFNDLPNFIVTGKHWTYDRLTVTGLRNEGNVVVETHQNGDGDIHQELFLDDLDTECLCHILDLIDQNQFLERSKK